jgi:hypothetical protein
MNYLDEQIEAAMGILRSAGGTVWIDPDSPDEIKQAFLNALWSCSDCRALLQRKR